METTEAYATSTFLPRNLSNYGSNVGSSPKTPPIPTQTVLQKQFKDDEDSGAKSHPSDYFYL